MRISKTSAIILLLLIISCKPLKINDGDQYYITKNKIGHRNLLVINKEGVFDIIKERDQLCKNYVGGDWVDDHNSFKNKIPHIF